MSVRMRHTRAHTANRRSHHALTEPRLSACVKCGTLHMRHRMCAQCGSYKGREVVDILKKVEKKEERKKAKLKSLGQEEKEVSETPEKLDAKALSSK